METLKANHKLPEGKHIMISYSWNCRKDLVNRLSEVLKKSGLKVWKDDEGGMSGNILDDMAHAVQNAALMIVCVSEAYCASDNCKRELEYGANLKREMVIVKLDSKLNLIGKGAISLLLGSKLYIEFTGDESQLFNEIGNAINQKLGIALDTKPAAAALKPNTKLDGKVYIDNRWGYKAGSFHWDESVPYISYENASSQGWKCINGQPPPPKMYFEKFNYNEGTRVFTGGINWGINPLIPFNTYWHFRMVFSADMSKIESGENKVFCGLAQIATSPFEKDLFYRLYDGPK